MSSTQKFVIWIIAIIAVGGTVESVARNIGCVAYCTYAGPTK